MDNLVDRAMLASGWLATVVGAALRIFAKVGAVLCVGTLLYKWLFSDQFDFLSLAPVALLSLCGAAFLIGTAVKHVGLTLVGKTE
ncbi:hypothetical protein [Stenotrophomonas oahuensis]|uniref:Uncharacterized protein n=1 Tax=Stenotrophomonas oahuensis TaxID=3003271 RepID=A0ABY9YUZ3_9GAMM|nr:hypothetical protein [Stenotrophomonas sp. A5586]WNH54808.1 hypothetical protein PDM29_20910 [Stenotrophomonas sp. A5586]